MSTLIDERITFEVETSRVLEILSKEIYDSPLAMLRENVQNAYDAILMRASLEGTSLTEGRITVDLSGQQVIIEDNGIGMPEEVLRKNFWKAGSSGKRGELARRAGVIGTFGIGAMANFGVCTALKVETRAVASDETLISTAERDALSIAKECISLSRQKDERTPGTRLMVSLDPQNTITADKARSYLEPYVRYVPVSIYINGTLISQQSLNERYLHRTRDFQSLGTMNVKLGEYHCTVESFCDSNAVAACRVTNLSLAGEAVIGEAVFLQNSGQLMGLRNFFGLAPAPVSGYYNLGGVANLTILHPTAGREALSRDSIAHLNNVIQMAEFAISDKIGATLFADRSNGFMQYILSKNMLKLASNVTIEMLPAGENVRLEDILIRTGGRGYFYMGRDPQMIDTFASPESPLLCVGQSNPRKGVHARYLREIIKFPEVPDRATITKIYDGPSLSFEEAAFLVRISTVLSDDYLLPNATVRLADITHGVNILVERDGENVHVSIAKGMNAIQPILNCYRTAPEVFSGFVKDFVRGQLYKKISDFVPSSTRQGADVLFKLLQRNRELYRYEQSELGELEPLLADVLSGNKNLGEVIRNARTHSGQQSVRVQKTDIGQLEQHMPDVVSSPAPDEESSSDLNNFDAAPAVMRPDLECTAKILVANQKYPQLNGCELFLGLSDKALKREGEFFRFPHTTKVIWAGHRIVYIFNHASGGLTLYYDIELKTPLQTPDAAGTVMPSTTLFTKNRIFIPVPDLLVPEFRIAEGFKEFYVRFDVVVASSAPEME
ncbi:MAG: ATP-binding protein [Desulfobulbus sp.]|nr:ATP-binding protein [Desulfobulbus sp.]